MPVIEWKLRSVNQTLSYQIQFRMLCSSFFEVTSIKHYHNFSVTIYLIYENYIFLEE